MRAVGNIACGNNQFVGTLENFISTRRQKAMAGREGGSEREVAPQPPIHPRSPIPPSPLPHSPVKYIAIIYNRPRCGIALATKRHCYFARALKRARFCQSPLARKARHAKSSRLAPRVPSFGNLFRSTIPRITVKSEFPIPEREPGSLLRARERGRSRVSNIRSVWGNSKMRYLLSLHERATKYSGALARFCR